MSASRTFKLPTKLLPRTQLYLKAGMIEKPMWYDVVQRNPPLIPPSGRKVEKRISGDRGLFRLYYARSKWAKTHPPNFAKDPYNTPATKFVARQLELMHSKNYDAVEALEAVDAEFLAEEERSLNLHSSSTKWKHGEAQPSGVTDKMMEFVRSMPEFRVTVGNTQDMKSVMSDVVARAQAPVKASEKVDKIKEASVDTAGKFMWQQFLKQRTMVAAAPPAPTSVTEEADSDVPERKVRYAAAPRVPSSLSWKPRKEPRATPTQGKTRYQPRARPPVKGAQEGSTQHDSTTTQDSRPRGGPGASFKEAQSNVAKGYVTRRIQTPPKPAAAVDGENKSEESKS